ncbi:MAG: DUF4837 family protein [Bacteroidales bacterium]|nr:DUF4837 family protein [Bacteroidales bacterium]
MKKYHISVLALAFVLLVLSACDSKKDGPRMERSLGGTSEILVVTQNDEQWNGLIGDTIRSFFYQAQYGLPQPEELKKLAHVNVEGFTDMFKKHKCLLIVEINPDLEKPVVETGENVWAAPQRVVKIIAPDRVSWCKTFNDRKEAYKVWYDKVERERMLSIFRPNKDANIAARVKEKLGFDITIPQGYSICKDEPDFMWIHKELEKNSFGIFIYTTPYKDTIQLEMSNLVTVRDRMTQRYVPGPVEGSFMTTEKQEMPPVVNYTSNFPTGFAAEMRGMWCLVGDHMGGPFVSYTFPDDRTGNLVTVEGYIYYPNQKKRDDLLQVESMIYSIKMPEEE